MEGNNHEKTKREIAKEIMREVIEELGLFSVKRMTFRAAVLLVLLGFVAGVIIGLIT